MKKYTLKETNNQKITLTIHENSISIYNITTSSNKTEENSKQKFYNYPANIISKIKYETEIFKETKNKNGLSAIFYTMAIIFFIIFIIAVTNELSSVGIAMIFIAIICLVIGLLTTPETKEVSKYEFTIFNTAGEKIYSVQTILTEEQFEDIVQNIRAIQ